MKAYAAFSDYRDTGAEHSLLKAWRSQGHEAARSVPGQWQVCAGLFDWSGRAADYDRATLEEQRKEALETRRLEV